MAERFGGEFSPGMSQGGAGRPPGAPPPPDWRRGPRRAQSRVKALFFMALPMVIVGFTKDPAGLAINLIAAGLIFLAAFLTREGLKAEDAYNDRRVARRPAMPRKLFGSAIIGAGIGLAAFGSIGGVVLPILLGGLGAGLHVLAFGLDPFADKGMEGMDTFQTERVAKAVDEAEKHLSAMSDAILRARDRDLEARVERFSATAREMFRTVEEDPRDLTGARKYLGVYLLGAKDATVKFADLYSRTQDAQARKDYEDLLNDLETSFTERTSKMLLDDRTDLDVEIGVLRDRLDREGIRTE
ncbi:MAG: 5-bromo-4-chloroindolyl phosphate hydrolysis family protein [Pseudomonadota bacterium]